MRINKAYDRILFKVMHESITLTISINRSATDLYEQFWKPEAFPTWASGLATASLKRDENGDWKFQGPEGAVRITFTEHNQFYVMDHTVYLAGDKPDVYVPMRIVGNGEHASEVMLTLFRQPDMDDERFKRDKSWVNKDLLALKKLAEESSQE